MQKQYTPNCLFRWPAQHSRQLIFTLLLLVFLPNMADILEFYDGEMLFVLTRRAIVVGVVLFVLPCCAIVVGGSILLSEKQMLV